MDPVHCFAKIGFFDDTFILSNEYFWVTINRHAHRQIPTFCCCLWRWHALKIRMLTIHMIFSHEDATLIFPLDCTTSSHQFITFVIGFFLKLFGIVNRARTQQCTYSSYSNYFLVNYFQSTMFFWVFTSVIEIYFLAHQSWIQDFSASGMLLLVSTVVRFSEHKNSCWDKWILPLTNLFVYCS